MAKKLKIYNGSSWEDVTFAITPPNTAVTNSFTTNQVIDTSTSVAALRVTQRGTGEAIRVEDDTSPDSTPFVVTSSGNVGIGTSTPDRPLKISGPTATIGLVGTSTGGAEISIDAPNNSNGFAQIDVGGANALRFNTNAAERMRIHSDGNISIGTSVNNGKLLISSSNATTDLNIRAYDDATKMMTIQADNNVFRFISRWTTGSGGEIAWSTGQPILERMRLDASGQLNITNGKIIINSTASVTGANWAESMLHLTGINDASSHPGMTWHAPGASAVSIFHIRGTQTLQILGNAGIVDTTSGRNSIRNIAISTSTPSGGNDGDMWATYV
jgi:hypothetical protein